ncbi:putative amidohydrolase [Streptomyces sp. Amel2xB2]|uniref:carbon-nitrogen hydrolase family protein n=1 Tax=Streptomyces sp. Amel2xB2 TaxID=1305829 RepID=UPI000DBFFC3B|nr:carbon-nitrogen hydrolase family protein [Streptomyces sp. Amel2xB2]RAJ71311.1 putative amidohydrolase [Streptomyces sp. Amel2xB2]
MSPPPVPLPLPASPLVLAAAQTESLPGDPAHNARRAAAVTARAAARGARVVVFPELHLCGYDLAALARPPRHGDVRADADGNVTDPRLDPLAAAAAEHAVTVLTGAAVRRADGALTDSVLAFGPSGRATVAYDKQHLWHDEEARLFTPGDRGTVLVAEGWRLGLGVCYDMSFPEHGRDAALAGAHAYVCPSAYAAGAEHRARVYLAARALENTVYAAFVNPVGGPTDRPCDGGSALFGPDGATVARTRDAHETTLHAVLDPGDIARTRTVLRMLAECRTEQGKRPREVRI